MTRHASAITPAMAVRKTAAILADPRLARRHVSSQFGWFPTSCPLLYNPRRVALDAFRPPEHFVPATCEDHHHAICRAHGSLGRSDV